MQRKILLIYDERKSWGARANNSRRSTIGFHWFRKLINSDHNHQILILVVDYAYHSTGGHDFFYRSMKSYIEEFKEYRKLRNEGVQVFFSDDVLSDFSEDIQIKLKKRLENSGITLVNPSDFFIKAVNDGFELFF